jgi:hypothetical protein
VTADVQPDEVRLAAEIDRLKAEFPKARELYREVCALLFVRFGITPTANRLYQLVKRGSMSTPTQVLGESWVELRAKSRVRIDHADLRAAAGELVATLWTRSTASAQVALGQKRRARPGTGAGEGGFLGGDREAAGQRRTGRRAATGDREAGAARDRA